MAVWRTRRSSPRRTAFLVSLGAALLLTIGRCAWGAAGDRDALAQGFEEPPQSARPLVWWHWLDGNITREGITLDLEWMKRIGLGGFQMVEASLGGPRVVDHPLLYMTPEWQDAVRFAISEAQRLGLAAGIDSSPGWSETGGPGVEPAAAMKKLVWSEVTLSTEAPLRGPLPLPPQTAGPFQDQPHAEFVGPPSANRPPEFYRDVAVLAYRLPPAAGAASGPFRLTRGHGADDGDGAAAADLAAAEVAALTDGRLVTYVDLPIEADGASSWLQYVFPAPVVVRSVTFALQPDPPLATLVGFPPAAAEFEVSDDGRSFRPVLTLTHPGSMSGQGAVQTTVSFPAVRGRYFRARLSRAASPIRSLDFSVFGMPPFTPSTVYRVAEFELHGDARVQRFEEKAGFGTAVDLSQDPTPAAAPESVVDPHDVRDLTALLRPDGTLTWTPPPGRWRVQRFGYSLTGAHDAPAPAEATGLEVDKLSREHVQAYLDHYLGQYQDILESSMGSHGLTSVLTDSWEAGSQNWTEDLLGEFQRRRGYDLRPWLPVLSGHVVDSAAASDRLLWDFRRTLGDLYVDHHYAVIAADVHRRGMTLYSESHEVGRALAADGMRIKQGADVPTGAMWTQAPGVDQPQFGFEADLRESASVSHVYGQNLVGAESLTAGQGAWAWFPARLKATADQEMALGVNRFAIHTSVHQPSSAGVPGLSLGPFGQWFNRNETWAEQAGPWIRYLARSSFMLQQGRFVADIAYFYGEDSNLTALFAAGRPDLPPGYSFDYVNDAVLEHELAVRDGELVTRTGMSYRVLVLDPRTRSMSLPVLRSVRALVLAGAVVVGARPVETPSLEDDAAEFTRLADEVWGDGAALHAAGAGRVYGAAGGLQAALADLDLRPDVEYGQAGRAARAGVPAPLVHVHRRLAGGDVYFIDNRSDHAALTDVTFRVVGRVPELWHADTGIREAVSYRTSDGRTTVPLRLDPWETVFVVFRRPALRATLMVPAPLVRPLTELTGPWRVQFEPGRGAPAEIRLDGLSSLSTQAQPGVRYFSGAATYTVVVSAPREWLRPGTDPWLELGDVKNLAQVAVNGKTLGILWKPPYRLDLGRALRPGRNLLAITVTNSWVNRLIGDAQPGNSRAFTRTEPAGFYPADAPLPPSGLLGPVRLVQQSRPTPPGP